MLKLAFVDINDEVEPFVLRWLSRIADCCIVPQHELKTAHPHILFYGDGKSGAHRNVRDCTRVCITYENLYPDFSECDYCMAYLHLDHPRYLRMPDWAIIHQPEQFLKEPGYADRIINESRDFCAFVASKGNLRRTRKRVEFFKQLNCCKRVNSGGRVMNNVGEPVADHYAFARKHRFYMAFENASYPGYTTEKIADGMTNGCIPIYWGDPMVGADFNPRSFINVSNFSDDAAAIRHILEIEDQPSLYRRYLEEPFFHENKIPSIFDEQRVLSFFKRILEEPRPRRKLFSLRAPLFKIRRRMQPYLEASFSFSGSAPKPRKAQPSCAE